MPSLILELTDKTDKKRLEQARKWFEDISFFYHISRERYIYTEIIFRQLIMHEKFNTAFAYENEKPIKFPIKGDKLTDIIDPYLEKIRTTENYGLHPLVLQKMDRIKSAEQAIQKRYANIDKLKDFFSQLKNDGTGISPDDVLTHIDKLKIKTNTEIQSRILKSEKHSLKKFITITKNGEIVVSHRSFDFLKVYSLLMYCLMEPHWIGGLEAGKSKVKALYGIHGYIARKLNFEFGQRLGFKPTSKDVADKVRDNENQIKIYKSKLKSLGL